MGFFFGAGASIEARIPLLAQITSSFAIEIGRKGVGKRRKWFLTRCTKSLAKVHGKDRLDLEVIMSVIVGLKDKERLLENMGDL